MTERSIVGDLINFRGLVYAPLNEQGVVFLFGKVAHDLNMYVEEIKPGFPDCVGRRFVGKGWERVRIEFEFQSSSFKTHGHNADECDVIVCWKHDWDSCPIEVVELSSEICGMDNPPIERPGGLGPSIDDADARLTAILKRLDAKPEVGEWYKELFDHVRQVGPRWGTSMQAGTALRGPLCPSGQARQLFKLSASRADWRWRGLESPTRAPHHVGRVSR